MFCLHPQTFLVGTVFLSLQVTTIELIVSQQGLDLQQLKDFEIGMITLLSSTMNYIHF